MTVLPTSEARAELSDLVNRVAYGGERIVLERHGRHVAALVPMTDFARLEAGPGQVASAKTGAGAGIVYAVRDLPGIGPVLLAASDAGLWRLSFGRPSAALAGRLAEEMPAAVAGDSAVLRRAEEELREYLAGRRKVFRVPVDPAAYPQAFARRVLLDATRAIPFGVVRTYGEIARAVGKPGAARAVGGALGRNPVPIVVPCHRVVATGGLGGYSGGAEGTGLQWKRQLLRLEGGAREDARPVPRPPERKRGRRDRSEDSTRRPS
jgi:methylated-DNA-[protein]-cysteine S-methyltransferase